ncbi:MAG: iron-containing redox enzyme family protein [Methylobacter sp.]|nr:iron-containing redox enzyme family protein [Methylobacter sp.]
MKTNSPKAAFSGFDTTGLYIKPEWLQQLGNTRFLTRCQNGRISRDELATFIQQHQMYSRCFTRFLAALLANIEDDDHRLALTQNLFDEMGLGDAGNLPHSKLYRHMMESMRLIPCIIPLPSTQRLVDTMWECCHSPNYMVGLEALCLGAEGIVPYIYQWIVDGFLAAGDSLDNLQFFTLHIQCDDGHAETMKDIIAWELQKAPSALLDLNYGAEKMIQARVGFFEGLSAGCPAPNHYAV